MTHFVVLNCFISFQIQFEILLYKVFFLFTDCQLMRFRVTNAHILDKKKLHINRMLHYRSGSASHVTRKKNYTV